jgi:cell division FtsZ-interacting protein ZapD
MKKSKINEMYKINERINELKELSKHLGRGDVTYRNFIKSIITATESIELEIKSMRQNEEERVLTSAKKIAEANINEAFKKYLKTLATRTINCTDIKRFLK